MDFPTTPEARSWLIKKLAERPLEAEIKIGPAAGGREIAPGVSVSIQSNIEELAVSLLSDFTRDLQMGRWRQKPSDDPKQPA